MAVEPATCVRCGGEINIETSMATAAGPRHGICPPPVVEFHPGKGKDRYYLIDGQREIAGLPIKSVTEILKEIGDKFGVAAWWGMKVGVEGYSELLARQEVNDAMEVEQVVPLLTEHKLTVNHVRDKAGDRGTSVHAAAEKWAETGIPPEPTMYDDPERPYVEALLSFIATEKPEPKNAEVRVGSRVHAYAGTFDLLAKHKTLGLGVWDFKTKSKPEKKPKAYEQHHLQLRAYEDARIEMGGQPSDFQCVVNLYPDGTYALVQGCATSQMWRDALAAYRSLTALKAAIKEAA